MGTVQTKVVDNIICSKLHGELDIVLSNQWVAQLEDIESSIEKSSNRFHDVREIDAIHLTFDDLWEVAQHRYKTYKQLAPTHTAFWVSTPLNYGIARMYQALTDGTPFKIEVFYHIEEISDFLQIEKEKLQNITF